MQQNKWNWKEKREKKAFLALEDGSVYHGYAFGAKVDNVGEVVFNTGLTGYQEIITDPSYCGQFVTMTYPEIGNTGVNSIDRESRGLFLNGFIINELNESLKGEGSKLLILGFTGFFAFNFSSMKLNLIHNSIILLYFLNQ